MALIYEKRDKVAYITVNRPEAMNSLDPETLQELSEARRDFCADDEMRVAILTGAGERAFSAGADLKKTMPPVGDAAHSPAALFWKPEGRYLSEFFTASDVFKPMIAAINGYCLAGGLELALSCDIRIASENATFGVPEVQIASFPGGGATKRLTLLMPQAAAMKMLLLGERINAQQALQWGLVSDVVPVPDLMPTAEKITQRIVSNGPLGVKATKQMLELRRGLSTKDIRLISALFFGLLRDTEDRIEGRRAFAEKRKPVFREM